MQSLQFIYTILSWDALFKSYLSEVMWWINMSSTGAMCLDLNYTLYNMLKFHWSKNTFTNIYQTFCSVATQDWSKLTLLCHEYTGCLKSDSKTIHKNDSKTIYTWFVIIIWQCLLNTFILMLYVCCVSRICSTYWTYLLNDIFSYWLPMFC